MVNKVARFKKFYQSKCIFFLIKISLTWHTYVNNLKEIPKENQCRGGRQRGEMAQTIYAHINK
jgi:hypothetical protein